MTIDILILSNGPGEVTTWVRPVVQALRQQLGNDYQVRISVVLSPCPHASGKEAKIAQSYPEVDRVQSAEYFWQFLLWGNTAQNWDFFDRGVVLFLGGDQVFPVIIGKRLGYRTVVYAEWDARWQRWIDRFGVMKPEIIAGVSQQYAHKFTVVGDLMAEAAAGAGVQGSGGAEEQGCGGAEVRRCRLHKDSNSEQFTPAPLPPCSTAPLPTPVRSTGETPAHGWLPCPSVSTAPNTELIGLLPGSKPAKLAQGVPLSLAIAQHIHTARPQTRFVIPVAPTLDLQTLADFANTEKNPVIQQMGGVDAELVMSSSPSLKTSAGLCVELWTRSPAYDLLSQCSLCLTTIGANTAELGALAVPMIVLLPTQQLDAMRAWNGLPGLLANLPVVGSGMAKIINLLMLRRLGLLAWPNIWAQSEVVPELVGNLQPQAVAELALDFLDNPEKLQQMRDRLRSIRGKPGAAQKLAQMVCEELGTRE